MKFKPPTRTEAIAYAKSIGYRSFDYNVWYAFYETRGWHVGRTGVMRSWKGSIQTWFHRTDEYERLKHAPKPKPVPVAKKAFVPVSAERKAEIQKKYYPQYRPKTIEPLETEAELEKRCDENRNRMRKELFKEK